MLDILFSCEDEDSYNKILVTWYLFLQIIFNNIRAKSQSILHWYKQWLYKFDNVYEDEIKTQNRQKTQKTQKDERLVF